RSRLEASACNSRRATLAEHATGSIRYKVYALCAKAKAMVRFCASANPGIAEIMSPTWPDHCLLESDFRQGIVQIGSFLLRPVATWPSCCAGQANPRRV